jgi:hypothetical protein
VLLSEDVFKVIVGFFLRFSSKKDLQCCTVVPQRGATERFFQYYTIFSMKICCPKECIRSVEEDKAYSTPGRFYKVCPRAYSLYADLHADFEEIYPQWEYSVGSNEKKRETTCYSTLFCISAYRDSILYGWLC